MKKILMLSAAALILQATPVFAQDTEGSPASGPRGEHHLKHDTNGDGLISKDEFLAGAEERFSKMDANGDGSISKEEGMARHKEMKEKYGEFKEKRGGMKEKRQDRRGDRSQDTSDSVETAE